MMLPPVLISFFVILFGLIVGSFLNVVIYRLPLDQSIIKPGSFCPKCQTPIHPFFNFPLLGYLFLRGKCRACKEPISWRYPFVEFLTALLFWLAFRGNLGLELHAILSQIRLWVFLSLCIAITFIDLDHRIIPDELSLGGWAFGALTAYFDFRNGGTHLLLASIGGFGFFFGFALLYEKITGRVGLGGGDIKFMGTIGVFLGFGGIWSSLMISSIVGSIVGITWAKLQAKNEPMLRTAIPYGPFLVIGALVELYFEVSQWIGL